MYKKILVPIDNSECSRRALSSAVRLAKIFKAELEIFHVNYIPLMYWGNGLPSGVLLPQRDFESQGDQTMDLVVSEVNLEAIEVEKKIKSGFPVQTILEEITNRNIDLVVMGTHGLGGIGRALFGSVSYEVFRYAKCPVLIIK